MQAGISWLPVAEKLIAILIYTFCALCIVMALHCTSWTWFFDAATGNPECGSNMRHDLTQTFQVILGFMLAYKAGSANKD